MTDSGVIKCGIQELSAEKAADQLVAYENRRGKIAQTGMTVVGNRTALMKGLFCIADIAGFTSFCSDYGRACIFGTKI